MKGATAAPGSVGHDSLDQIALLFLGPAAERRATHSLAFAVVARAVTHLKLVDHDRALSPVKIAWDARTRG